MSRGTELDDSNFENQKQLKLQETISEILDKYNLISLLSWQDREQIDRVLSYLVKKFLSVHRNELIQKWSLSYNEEEESRIEYRLTRVLATAIQYLQSLFEDIDTTPICTQKPFGNFVEGVCHVDTEDQVKILLEALDDFLNSINEDNFTQRTEDFYQRMGDNSSSQFEEKGCMALTRDTSDKVCFRTVINKNPIHGPHGYTWGLIISGLNLHQDLSDLDSDNTIKQRLISIIEQFAKAGHTVFLNGTQGYASVSDLHLQIPFSKDPGKKIETHTYDQKYLMSIQEALDTMGELNKAETPANLMIKYNQENQKLEAVILTRVPFEATAENNKLTNFLGSYEINDKDIYNLLIGLVGPACWELFLEGSDGKPIIQKSACLIVVKDIFEAFLKQLNSDSDSNSQFNQAYLNNLGNTRLDEIKQKLGSFVSFVNQYIDVKPSKESDQESQTSTDTEGVESEPRETFWKGFFESIVEPYTTPSSLIS